MTKKDIVQKIVFICASFLLLYILSCRYPAISDTFASQSNGWESFNAKVTKVLDTRTLKYDDASNLTRTVICFEARLSSKDKDLSNKTIVAIQVIDDFMALQSDAVSSGDSIIILKTKEESTKYKTAVKNKDFVAIEDESIYIFEEYRRTNAIFVLAILFVVIILLFGRTQGFNTVISLLLTCLAVFYYFIPSIFAGTNIYATSIVTCLYITVMTICIVSGIGKKAFIAITGCFSGVLVTGLITLIMMKILKINGYTSNDALYLVSIVPGGKTDLLAIIFASIIIGGVGAVMDVAISIASSLHELSISAPNLSFKALLKSGFAIGRDIMGTMANTLILAYIGNSLMFLLVLIAYNPSLKGLLNHQLIVVQLLQSLAGSIGIFCSIPLTALIASFLYSVKIEVRIEEKS